MSTPGSNIYRKAVRLIRQQTVSYRAWTGRATNAAGIDVNTYATAVDIKGSFQPVPRHRYADLNLDFNKSYVNFFCPQELLDLQRDVSGDIFTFAGITYKVESLTPWYAVDGWVEALAVRTTAGDA